MTSSIRASTVALASAGAVFAGVLGIHQPNACLDIKLEFDGTTGLIIVAD